MIKKWGGLYPTLSWCLALALLAVGLSSAWGQDDNAAMEEKAFWQLVSDTRAGLEGQPGSDRPNPEAWARLAERWEQVSLVRLENGQIEAVDTHFIVEQMRATPANPRVLQAYLQKLEAARDGWLQRPVDASQDLKRLEDILARPEFQWQPQTVSPLQVLWDRVMEFLLKATAWILRLGGSSSQVVPGWVGPLVVALLFGGMVAYIIHGAWKSTVSEAELLSPDANIETLSPESSLQRAQQMAESGDYRQATRYLYLSALLRLDENGLLRYDRALTNREYLRQAASQPGLVGPLRAIIETFDRVWYGFQPIDASAYQDYAQKIQQLRSQPPARESSDPAGASPP